MKIRNYLIGAAAIAMLASCGNKKEEGLSTDIVNNPLSASGSSDSKNLPVITFAEEAFEFGHIKQGDKVTHDFKFKNTGKTDLIISSATGSCGCTIPDFPKEPIAPGKEGIIHVIFNSEGKSGKQHKTVTVVSNTIPNTEELSLTGEVETPEEKK